MVSKKSKSPSLSPPPSPPAPLLPTGQIKKKKKKKNPYYKKKKKKKTTTTNKTAFTAEDVKDSFDIQYRVIEQIDTRTFHARVLKGLVKEWFDVTIQLYESNEEARYVYGITNSAPSDSCIVRAYWLDFPKGGYPTIIFEKFYPLSFQTWSDQVSDPWIKEDGTTTILSGGEAFTKVFKGITKALKALHYDHNYHGELMDGIRISNSNSVQLVDFRRKDTEDIGMWKDLRDLQKLVDNFCRDPDSKTWAGLTLFKKLDNFFLGKLTSSTRDPLLLRTYAFFTYHSTLFYEEMDQNTLVLKLLEFRRINASLFDSYVKLNADVTDIGEWQKVAEVDDDLKKVLHDGRASYKRKGSFVLFVQNCRKHMWGHKKTPCEVQVKLHRCFPNFIHQLYYSFVIKTALKGDFNGFEVLPFFRTGVARFN